MLKVVVYNSDSFFYGTVFLYSVKIYKLTSKLSLEIALP